MSNVVDKALQALQAAGDPQRHSAIAMNEATRLQLLRQLKTEGATFSLTTPHRFCGSLIELDRSLDDDVFEIRKAP